MRISRPVRLRANAGERLDAGGSNPRLFQIGVTRSIQLTLKTKGDGGPVCSMLCRRDRLTPYPTKLEQLLLHACLPGPTGAATKLGLPSRTLDSKIKRLKINVYRFKAPR